MNKEQLIAKKVKHAFNGKETLFSVDSLNEHFDGLQIHESDVLYDEFEDQDEGYVKSEDVNFDFATPKEVYVEESLEEGFLSTFPDPIYNIGIDPFEIEEEAEKEMSFEEAEKILDAGNLVSLPEWEGFWFKNLINGQLLVFTKDNEILDTPDDEYKLRTDWISVKANPEQELVLENYFAPKEVVDIVVTDHVTETGDKKEEKVLVTEEKIEIQESKEEIALPKPRGKKSTKK